VPRLPVAWKLLHSAWMAVYLAVYLHQYPLVNFLWLCNFVNFLVFLTLWRESARLASAALAGVAVIHLLWAVDFFGRLLGGVHLIGGTEYMFDPTLQLLARGISFYHLWTVPLLVVVLRRLGHDRRGLALQIAVATVLFPLGQQLGGRKENINWTWNVFGVDQTLLPPLAFAFVAVAAVSLVLFLPVDLLARRLFKTAAAPPALLPRR
jgi:hypothetical protein